MHYSTILLAFSVTLLAAPVPQQNSLRVSSDTSTRAVEERSPRLRSVGSRDLTPQTYKREAVAEPLGRGSGDIKPEAGTGPLDRGSGDNKREAEAEPGSTLKTSRREATAEPGSTSQAFGGDLRETPDKRQVSHSNEDDQGSHANVHISDEKREAAIIYRPDQGLGSNGGLIRPGGAPGEE